MSRIASSTVPEGVNESRLPSEYEELEEISIASSPHPAGMDQRDERLERMLEDLELMNEDEQEHFLRSFFATRTWSGASRLALGPQEALVRHGATKAWTKTLCWPQYLISVTPAAGRACHADSHELCRTLDRRDRDQIESAIRSMGPGCTSFSNYAQALSVGPVMLSKIY